MAFDINNPADLATLKNEVLTDPEGYGYDPASTYDGVLNIINEKRASITVSKPYISPSDVVADTYYEAYNGLAIDEQEWLRWITSGGSSEETLKVTADLREQLTGATGGGTQSMWAVGDRPAMEQAMLDLIDIDCSRAEEIFGYGTTISRNDWIAARAS